VRCHAAYIQWLDSIHHRIKLTPAGAEKMRQYVTVNRSADISMFQVFDAI